MRALVVDRSAPSRLALDDVAEPALDPGAVLVGIERVGLHPSDAAALESAADGARVGRDFAGTVLRVADDGTGPALGSRVVGTCDGGACAERLAGRAALLAVVPDDLELDEVVGLPLPGLAAWLAIERVGFAFGRRLMVLDAGSTIGQYACQLGVGSGMRTRAVVARTGQATWVRAHGVTDVAPRSAVRTERPPEGDTGDKLDLIVDAGSWYASGTLGTWLEPGGSHLRVDLGVRPSRPGRPVAGDGYATVRPLRDALNGAESPGTILSRWLVALSAGEAVVPLGGSEPPIESEVGSLLATGSTEAFLAGIRWC